MINLIDAILAHVDNELQLTRAINNHAEIVQSLARRGDIRWVAMAEAAVRQDPARAFAFDNTGAATLRAAERSWHAGRIETPSIGELRARVQKMRGAGGECGRIRLWVLDGASPMTDIGSLQASSGAGALFQVASQFNCLESPGPFVTDVADYLEDPTQGPRASISAFPATLLRHYAAPGSDGQRFVQETDKRQIDLVADACGPGASRNGYFTGRGVADVKSLVATLDHRFEAIRVGVHDEVEVVLGGNWDGGVPDSHQRIAQVFTSTVAGGGYGGDATLGAQFSIACRQLLRAAYLGTLLAAASLGKDRAVLTLIGGGVFGNPIPLIWNSILWAIDQVQPLLTQNFDVILNGYSLGMMINLKTEILPSVRTHGGAIIQFSRDGSVAVYR